MTLRRIAIIVPLLALVGVGVWQGTAVYWFVLTRQSPGHGSSTGGVDGVVKFGGYSRFSRWSKDTKLLGESVKWYADSGHLYSRSFHRSDGSRRTTTWNADGTIRFQMESDMNPFDSTHRREPPWLWGEEDQTSPTAPWVLQGTSMRDWYLAEVGVKE